MASYDHRDRGNDIQMDADADVRPEPISGELEQLADDLVDYGLGELGEHGHLVTTLSVEDDHGNCEMLSFDDEDVHECVAKAREIVRTAHHTSKKIEGLAGKPQRYAIAYDGAIRESDRGPYQNALIIEYGERGMTSGYSAYLLYKKAGRPKDFVWTDPAAAGETELLV